MDVSVSFVSGNLTRNSGGIFEIETNLSKALLVNKVKVNIIGLEDEYWKLDKKKWLPLVPSSHKCSFPKFYKYSSSYYSALEEFNSDIGHSHLLWMYPNLSMYKWAKKEKKPYLITMHGMLDEWTFRNSYWKKKMIWHLYEKKSLANANCLHVNSMSELISLRKFGLKTPTCVIPNGLFINSNKIFDTILPKWKKEIYYKNKKILLFLGRIHQKKGLDNLIIGWQMAKTINKDWILIIAGWGEISYQKKLEKLVKENNLDNSVYFVGPQFEIEKERTFINADAFILPSFSEGFPMSILEAWSFSLPVLMTPNCNIPEGFDFNAALNIAPSKEGVYIGLTTLFSLSNKDLLEMGQNGYNLVRKNYNWKIIAKKMKELYMWLLGGNQPSTVEVFK